MPKIKDNLIIIFNKLFRRSSFPMLTNVSKQNYNKYYKTYDTLAKLSEILKNIDAYLIGGISAAIQTNKDFYRQNEDIDIMCKEEQLPSLIKFLQDSGYIVDDRRGIRTRNTIDVNGQFHAIDHELNANTKSPRLLGVGIFTYSIKGNDVITHSYFYDEKEEKVIGIEKVMPKELFDLMYNNNVVDYKGLKLKTQSKEYIYLRKSRGNREKDQLDASVVEPTLNNESKEKIARINELEAKVKQYRLFFDEAGNLEEKKFIPSLEDSVNSCLDSLYMNSSTKTPEQIINDVLQSDQYKILTNKYPEITLLINKWKEKTKNYTYRDKIRLINKDYAKKLQGFDRNIIDNVLDFLQRRSQNHGENNDDIELEPEASKIFELMTEYEQAIKKIFVENNIYITHITSIAPDQLEGGILKKSIGIPNNYKTEKVNGVFASSSTIDENNPYVARNSSGMIRLGNSIYIYGSDIIEVVKDSKGKKHAMLKQPNYIYHINPDSFNPVCTLTIDSKSNKPVFEFSEEWISNSEVNVSDPNQVRNVNQVQDVTSLLEHYTILCAIR